MERLNSGHLQLGLVALALGFLQAWWIRRTLTKRDLEKPAHEIAQALREAY
jgi:Flp pilus assembly protein TadB